MLFLINIGVLEQKSHEIFSLFTFIAKFASLLKKEHTFVHN
jgi:hypothetical protein